MEREQTYNQELRKSYESKLVADQSIKFLNQPTFVQAGLWYYQKYSNVRAQNFYQIYFAAELLKTLGNNYYKQQRIELALEAYQEAICIFRYIKPSKDAVKRSVLTDKDLEYICYQSTNENENRKVNQIQHVLYLNLSICYIKTHQYSNAIAACTFDLEIEPLSVKSLYRRALARFQQNSKQKRDLDLKLAIADLKKALEVDPNDEDIKELLCQVEENQNFKKQTENSNKQQSDVDSNQKAFSQNTTKYQVSQNQNDNLSVSSSNSSRTAYSTQKSQQSSGVLKESIASAAPATQTQKQVETDLISAKSTPQTLEKVQNLPLANTNNDQSKESENKENNSSNQIPQQQYDNYHEYLLKTQPTYKEYHNRLVQLAQKQQTKNGSQKLNNFEFNKASAASFMQNIKNGNQQQVQQQQVNKQQQQQQQELQQQQQKQQFKQLTESSSDEKESQISQKQSQSQKQLSSQMQQKRAKEKKKLAEQARILKEIEEEKEQQKKLEQEAELQKQNQLKLQQQKQEQERLRQEQIEIELSRQALKNKILDAKSINKKGGRKIKTNLAPSLTKQQPIQMSAKENGQQQQSKSQSNASKKNDGQQEKSQQSTSFAQSILKKFNFKKQKQVFDEDEYFDKKEEERLKQFKQNKDDDDEDYNTYEPNDPLENEPPYIPPDPQAASDHLDLCEGNQILKQREKDKIFQNSYKANYQDYLDQRHILDSDVDVPEIPGLIPPSYKTFAQKRREFLLKENSTQEKKELKKYQKILLWVSIIVFIFTLWWNMGDDVPEVPVTPIEPIENDDFISDNLNLFD
ncbi:hypothetical protein ABPG74_006567 [Tetrahymena malaccensis]